MKKKSQHAARLTTRKNATEAKMQEMRAELQAKENKEHQPDGKRHQGQKEGQKIASNM